MRKCILFGLSALVLCNCTDNKISQQLVQKYETRINTELKDQINLINQEYSDINIQIPNFKCNADNDFIKCVSNDIIFSYQEQEFFNIKSLEFRSNEVYKGKDEGLISIKKYYDELFKDNKKLETSFNIKGFKLSKEISQNILENATIISNDENMINFLTEVVQDEYNLDGVSYTTSSNGELKFEGLEKLYNTKNSVILSLDGSVSIKELMFDVLEKEMNAKFDTQTLNFDKNFTDKLNNQFDLLFPKLADIGKEFSSINDVKLNISLDTKNAFEPYVNVAKGYLGMQKSQSKDEKEALIIDKTLSLLEDITKTPTYKLNIEAKFKNTLLKDYQKEGTEVVQKFTINDRDFTEILKDFTGNFIAGFGSDEPIYDLE